MKAAPSESPWLLRACGDEGIAIEVGERPIAAVWPDTIEGWVLPMKANAHLISAAPDYHAATELFLAYERAVEEGNDIDAMLLYAKAADALKAAHTKAKGEV